METNIIPYVELNNGWSISDEHMEWVFTRMLKCRLVKRTFPAATILTHADWITMVKSPANIVCIATNIETVVAVAWLNGFNRNHAWGHFCFFPEAWGKSVDVGRQIVKRWFSQIEKLDVILGRTPSDNRLAIKFAKRLGMTESGTLPMIGFDTFKNQKTDVVLSYIKRGEI